MLEEFRGTLNYGIALKMQEALREAFGGDLAVVARLRMVMERKDIERLNRYHAQVREKMTPYLNEEEAAWLKEATREI